MYAGAVVLEIVEAVIPGGARAGLWPGIVAAAIAPLLFAAGPRLPIRVLAAAGPLGVVLIAAALATTHGYSDGAVLYMWPVLWAAAFFGRLGAGLVVVWIGMAHAVALIAMPAGQANIDRWVDVVASTAVVAVVVRVLVERNERLLARLEAEARIDPLTGVLNRRGMQERLDVELARAARDRTPIAVAAFDIDHFKHVNDEHGHEVGDRVLALLGATLAHEARGADVVARVGGEEFTVVLPGAEAREALTFAERVRRAFADPAGAERLSRGVPEGLVVTVSAGIAAAGPVIDEHALFEAADHALYAAKRSGRDRAVVEA